ncbi:MAG: DEAD/DEAH box helicase [Bacteroidales bacterium]|nr:DEAD/DEAH box helicase [Bacteroidales bacterium]
MNFTEFNLAPPVMEGVEAMGYEKPSPVQEAAIPLIMKGNDLIACAQTGTGKTAAFLLPLMHKILTERDNNKGIQALILAPTRELAIQIDQQLEGFGYFTNISSIAVYGGGSGSLFDQEKRALQSGADVVVATPGRLISHLNLGYVDFSDIRFLILDEADRMLDMGFLPDLTKIMSFLPKDKQTLLFSATMPEGIRRFSQNILKDPQHINLAVSKPAENVLQAAYLVHDNQKIGLIESLVSGKDLPLVLIFASTKSGVKEIEIALKRKKLNVAAIHSDLEQEQRSDVLNKFKNRDIQMLVATDIVSRGIDVDDISLVINYNVPGDAEDYVHRVGRTARAEKSGVALTFINGNEMGKFKRIEQFLGSTIRKLILPKTLGEGPSVSDYENQRQQSGGRPGNYGRGGSGKRPDSKRGGDRRSGGGGGSRNRQ